MYVDRLLHGFEIATFNATNLVYRKEQLLEKQQTVSAGSLR